MPVSRSSYVFMILSVFAVFVLVSPVFAENVQEVSATIEAAEEIIVSAYEAVLDAEKAGGDVSGLFVRLNEAGEFLAAARMSYESGDFENATRFAYSSRSVGEEVENAAYELKDLALRDSFQRIWFTLIGSISAIILVGVGSLLVWRFLKRRYP